MLSLSSPAAQTNLTVATDALPVASTDAAPQMPGDTSSLQASFFAQLGTVQPFRHLFDQLSDIHFFTKDKNGRYMAGSGGLLVYLDLKTEADLVGLTDEDIYPPSIAAEIRQQDRQIMDTREPMVDHVGALYERGHGQDWFLTTKYPLMDPQQRVIGVMGLARPWNSSHLPPADSTRMQAAITHIRRHLYTRLEVPSIAEAVGLSQRQLNRKFTEIFGISIQEYIMRSRLQSASNALLHSAKSVATIATDCGFCDQSAFGQQFRKHTGETPIEFRRRHSHRTQAKPKGK
jgi:AraC-like DNA-binding protein